MKNIKDLFKKKFYELLKGLENIFKNYSLAKIFTWILISYFIFISFTYICVFILSFVKNNIFELKYKVGIEKNDYIVNFICFLTIVVTATFSYLQWKTDNSIRESDDIEKENRKNEIKYTVDNDIRYALREFNKIYMIININKIYKGDNFKEIIDGNCFYDEVREWNELNLMYPKKLSLYNDWKSGLGHILGTAEDSENNTLYRIYSQLESLGWLMEKDNILIDDVYLYNKCKDIYKYTYKHDNPIQDSINKMEEYAELLNTSVKHIKNEILSKLDSYKDFYEEDNDNISNLEKELKKFIKELENDNKFKVGHLFYIYVVDDWEIDVSEQNIDISNKLVEIIEKDTGIENTSKEDENIETLKFPNITYILNFFEKLPWILRRNILKELLKDIIETELLFWRNDDESLVEHLNKISLIEFLQLIIEKLNVLIREKSKSKRKYIRTFGDLFKKLYYEYIEEMINITNIMEYEDWYASCNYELDYTGKLIEEENVNIKITRKNIIELFKETKQVIREIDNGNYNNYLNEQTNESLKILKIKK